MDLIFILTVVAALVGVIAGIVQVVQYFQDRGRNRKEKDPSVDTSLSAAGELTESEIKGQRLPLPEPEKSPILHNLPNADYGQFIGREAEMAKIYEILRPYPRSQHSIVTIDGIGGIGKSTLALEVAHYYYRNCSELPREEQFEAIIWVSAKQTILTAQGIQRRPQAFRTLEDFYATIAITLQRQDITKASPDEQSEIVRNALVQQRTLLIVDNLETVDDEKVITFLRELPAPTKAMITTRHRVDVAYPIRLKGMEEKDARRLIQHECEKRGHSLSDADSLRLVKYTGGVPLAIVWSIAQISSGYSTENVLRRLGDAQGDIAKFCFQGVIKNIESQPAFEVLLSLSIFEVDASREGLGEVADLSEIDRDDSLVLLEKLSLVNKNADRFAMLPLTKDYTYSILMNDENRLRVLRSRQHQYYLNKWEVFAYGSKPDDHLQKMEGRRFRELETNNILNHVDWCLSSGETEDVPHLIRGVSGYLWNIGQWTICHKYSQIALELSQQEPARKPDLEAYFLFRIGRIDLMRGDHEVSEKRLLRALDLYTELNNISRMAHVASYLGILYSDQGLYQQTVDALAGILEQARAANDKKAISRLQNVIGQAYLGLGKYNLAREAVEEALKFRQDDLPSTGLAASYELLGRINLHQGNTLEAVECFNQCYAISKEVNVSWYSAFAKKWLAEAMMEMNDYESAVASLTESIEIFRDTGMADKLAEAECLYEEAKKKISPS